MTEIQVTQDVVEVGYSKPTKMQVTQDVVEAGYVRPTKVHVMQEIVEAGYVRPSKVHVMQDVVEVGWVPTYAAYYVAQDPNTPDPVLDFRQILPNDADLQGAQIFVAPEVFNGYTSGERSTIYSKIVSVINTYVDALENIDSTVSLSDVFNQNEIIIVEDLLDYIPASGIPVVDTLPDGTIVYVNGIFRGTGTLTGTFPQSLKDSLRTGASKIVIEADAILATGSAQGVSLVAHELAHNIYDRNPLFNYAEYWSNGLIGNPCSVGAIPQQILGVQAGQYSYTSSRDPATIATNGVESDELTADAVASWGQGTFINNDNMLNINQEWHIEEFVKWVIQDNPSIPPPKNCSGIS